MNLPPYGLTAAIPHDAPASWGARIIVTQDGHVDLVPDRAGFSDSERKDELRELLLTRVSDILEIIRDLLRGEAMLTRSAEDFVLHMDDEVIVAANTNGSAGYCYVAAWLQDPTTNNDPDRLQCYSDHAHDISIKGECDWCGSTDPAVVGHVLPDIKRMKGKDPVQAAEMVLHAQSAIIFDGVLLDHFTASAIHAVHEGLTTDEAKAKLRSMSLTKAASVCFRLIK